MNHSSGIALSAAPHHTVSYAGLIGGGRWPKPGEISLAHRGVLFLDELPEFGNRMLEMLRQPLEDKVVSISRSAGSLSYPANFILVGSMNPCPCGFYTDPEKECTCSISMVKKYQQKISGPLMDRIDIHIEVPRVPFEKLSSQRTGEPSEAVRQRVEAARSTQRERFKEYPTANQRRYGAGGNPPVLRGGCHRHQLAEGSHAADAA
jgi:magnesium chelatase family protein